MVLDAETESYRWLIQLLLAFGTFGNILFIVVFLIEGWRRSDYNPIRHMVSALSTGENGWIQIINFIINGISVLGLAVALRFIIQDSTISFWIPTLMFVLGIGMIGAGLFVTDPVLGYPTDKSGNETLGGRMHNFASMVVFISLPVLIFVIVRTFSIYPDLKTWTIYSVISGILFIIFFICFITASALEEAGKVINAPVGLLQRLTIIIGWSWLACFAFMLSRRI